MSQHTRIAITPGEPAGIGPDIVIALAQQTLPCAPVVIADADLLQARAKQLNLPLQLHPYQRTNTIAGHRAGTLEVLHYPLAEPCRAGVLNPANAPYVLATLNAATQGCRQHEFAALVTGPVHKANINTAGIRFSGHTQYLAEQCGDNHVVMMLANQQLRVALATTHIPLAEVPAALQATDLVRALQIIHTSLQRDFAIEQPHIAVCGLNPHAGENGYLGSEEITLITPAIERARAQGLHISGPLPADTAFIPQQRYDVVFCMYHDQGLPVIKAQAFGSISNITLGLSIIRTSVDHGTALNLAGSAQADPRSLKAALLCALDMVNAHVCA